MTAPDAQAAEWLQAANACHDADPPRGAELLRRIDATALDPGQRPLYAFLLNHVLTEKLGQPAEAWQRQQALLKAAGADAPLPVLRHAAAAARLAGDAAGEDPLVSRLATVAGVGPAQAGELVGLAAASFRLPRLGGRQGDEAGELALAALAPLHQPAWQRASGLDAAAGALTNNLASDLAERPLGELRSAPLRQALAEAAALAQGFWQRAGQWVQHERAHYLCAIAANALGDAAEAERQARAGLALITAFDQAGQERVDQAFLRSELAHALARQGQTAEAAVERVQADALADDFDDAELSAWYQRRLARQRVLDGAA
ncbi:MAG: hypothetical protein U1F53_09265 [Burkholderiaceae bacterium]